MAAQLDVTGPVTTMISAPSAVTAPLTGSATRRRKRPKGTGEEATRDDSPQAGRRRRVSTLRDILQSEPKPNETNYCRFVDEKGARNGHTALL